MDVGAGGPVDAVPRGLRRQDRDVHAGQETHGQLGVAELDGDDLQVLVELLVAPCEAEAGVAARTAPRAIPATAPAVVSLRSMSEIS
ncbi:hypothetical protein BJF83_07315 [Nocardiopsis sp. CNR-923]|nr:hypothetical protein BJF83_07315 [Nocardiopsis sp. CNR-923]